MTAGAFADAFSPAFAVDEVSSDSATSASGLSASDLAAQTAGLFGTDIWLDVSRPDASGEANYVITPTGDLTLVMGREALRQSLIRRTITNPGEWRTLPNYGVGARQYVKGQNTPAKRAELESRIRANYLQDPRVLTVDTAIVTPLDDGSQGIRISVTVTPKGRLRSDQPMPVMVEIR